LVEFEKKRGRILVKQRGLEQKNVMKKSLYAIIRRIYGN
jgi:hypothetical protein